MKKTTPRSIQGVCLILMVFVFTVSFGQNPNTINFQSEIIEMPENIQDFKWNDMPESSKLNDGYIGWVQFYETPSQNVQDLFKQNQLQLLEYIPNKAYLFFFPKATSISFLKTNGVRSIIAVPTLAKMSAALKYGSHESWAKDGDNTLVTLEYYPGVSTSTVLQALSGMNIKVNHDYRVKNLLDVSIPMNSLNELAKLSFIKWVDLVNPPSTPDDTKGRSLHRANSLDTQRGAGRDYKGEGIGVLVRDDGKVGPHIDFEGRLTNISWMTGQTHGDGVAGIMAGAGNLLPSNRGMAAGSSVYVVDYVSHFLDSQTLQLINDGDVQITNSSYSDGCNSGYTSGSKTVDEQMFERSSLMHVFSAGNSNPQNCGYGAGSQWGNITGGHKQGKNVMTTANVYFDGELVSSSSRGPAYDGRIKPDIAANGQNQISTDEDNKYMNFGGTSAAAPGIAGISAQLYQAYGDINNGDFPPAALIKAALLNTTNDAGNIGPDYKFGWGIVNALQAVKLIEDERHLFDSITQGNVNNHTINVPDGTTQVRFMLYWSDPAAAPGANPALVNDLDLVVENPSSEEFLPWILDPTPTSEALNTPATTGVDSLNNMEQVLINNPASGDYNINISGFNVPMGPQEYFVVYEVISQNLALTYPNGGESFVPNSREVLHWDATNTTEDFVLEYSIDNGTTWENITTVSNDIHYFDWQVASDITGKGLIRVSSGDFEDTSDANFNIARIPAAYNVYEVCNEFVIFDISPVSDAEYYDLYILGEKYMEVVASSEIDSNEITWEITDPSEDFWYAVVAKNDTEGWESERTRAKYYEGGRFNCSLGIDQNNINNMVSLYPNPATNEVFVNLSDRSLENMDVTVLNSMGQVLYKLSDVNSSSVVSIDVSQYSSGLYFIKIEAGNNLATKKLIVN